MTKKKTDWKLKRSFNLRLEEDTYVDFATYCANEQISKNALIEKI